MLNIQSKDGVSETTMQSERKATELLSSATSPVFLPLLHDMLAMGVPDNTAIRWHNAIWLLTSHAEYMAWIIEENIDDKTMLHEAAKNFREAMQAIRPHAK